GLDGAAVVVRHEVVVLVAAADARALVRKCRGAGLVAGRDQITRPAGERDMKFRGWKARARTNRLEKAGQKSLGLAQTSDAQGLKVLLEEGARGFRILRPQVGGLAADVRQRGGELCALVRVPCLEHGPAAGLIGCESGEMIVGRPARELAPFD